jgi:hypothetical protein
VAGTRAWPGASGRPRPPTAPRRYRSSSISTSTSKPIRSAAAIVEEALVTSRYVHLAPDRPHTVLVRDQPAYRTIRGKVYVNDLREEFAYESDVTRRVLAGFEPAGIDPPAVDVSVAED